MTLTIDFTNHTFVTGHTIAFGSVQISVNDNGHPRIVIWDDANGWFAWPTADPDIIGHTPEPDHVFVRDHGPYKNFSRDLVALGVIEPLESTKTYGPLPCRALHARLTDKVLVELNAHGR